MKNTLEIIIPTYNRKPHIERTLKQLLAENSPVKDCQITVVNNASTDGCEEVIENFVKQYPNVKHIRNPRNLGLGGNIAKCYTLAKAPYVWVIGDDDSFKWDVWPEVEDALRSNEYDLLIVRQYKVKCTSNIAKIFRLCGYIAAGIYRTSVINNTVVLNMYNSIYTLFPHLAIVGEIYNRGGRIFLSSDELIDIAGYDKGNFGDGKYFRGYEGYIPDIYKNVFWTSGYLLSVQMIQDKKLRNYVLDNSGSHGFFGFVFAGFRTNYKVCNGSKYNEAIVRNTFDFWHRVQFDLACLLLKIMFLFVPKKH